MVSWVQTFGRLPIRIEDFHKRPQRTGLNRRSQRSRRWSLMHASGFMDGRIYDYSFNHDLSRRGNMEFRFSVSYLTLRDLCDLL
jgi:hypothetical protein